MCRRRYPGTNPRAWHKCLDPLGTSVPPMSRRRASKMGVGATSGLRLRGRENRERSMTIQRLAIFSAILLGVALNAVLLPAHAQSGGFERRDSVTYVTHDGVKLAGDLYLPDGPGPFPAIV